MKPNFALTLSFEGIGLLHRAFPGWHLVGEIDLDNDNLLADLKSLRDKAVALDPSGLRSKLVIPNDQIRYISFEKEDVPDGDLPDLVRRKLDGATPYSIDDLVYDWSDEGRTVKVAAVARETLREAEAFARDHRFNPISFVAIPESGSFDGEPFFGETTHARSLADPGETVERDPVPVRVIGKATLPEPEPSPETLSEPPAASDTAFTSSRRPAPEETPEPDRTEATGLAEPPAEFDLPEMVVDDPPDDTGPEAERPVASTPFDTKKESQGPPADDPDVTAFSSIRAQRGATLSTAPRLDGVARHFNPVPLSAKVNADSLPHDPDGDVLTAVAQNVSDTGLVEPEPEPETARIPAAPPNPEPIAPADHSDVISRQTRPVIAAKKPSFEEQQRMTIFGARDADPVGGKPKYLALILTPVLLLFLVGVAAWASIFLDEGLARFFRSDPEVRTADVPALPDRTPDATANEAELDAVVAALPRASDEVDEALQEALRQPRPVELTEDEVRAHYAATGIWLTAPEIPEAPGADDLDSFYQTSIDRAVAIQDAIALPDPRTLLADERPLTPNSPTGPDTKFAFDERGLVVATTTGALTPDGIRVFAGSPPVRPVAMPKREIVREVVTAENPEVQQQAGFRPQPRPGDLAETVERDTLSGRTRLELAALRPRLRPQGAQEAAELAVRQAAQDETPAETTASVKPFIDLDAVNTAVNAVVDANPDFDNATPQAVASSLKPNTRPRNFDAIVKRSAQSQQAAVAVSATQRVTPRIPTSTSVAKQATERNVLSLRKVNLIGVYGTPNARRALVRLSNGRYRKVKVGDRLDGGKVSAIGDGELRYQKSGRNVTLKMPRG